jgi:aminoglycoside/choline kinase family phosphotransferase
MSVPAHDPRHQDLLRWLASLPMGSRLRADSLRPASDDASFRRYFRVDCTDGLRPSLIVMDAPPQHERCEPFVRAGQVLGAAGVAVPTVLAQDLDQGFLLLEDFGDRTYLQALDQSSAAALYAAAERSLVRLQRASRPGVFPDYDRALLERELRLYPDWYVTRHKGLVLDAGQQGELNRGFGLLVDACLAQPRVFVHRDWHSRNLMVLTDDRTPGVLDFQDAVYGPITYDLVSLLRDAYIDWPEEQQIDWAVRYWQSARAAALPVATDFGEFYRDFEWMGLQRQIKVLGIFARLQHRDGKARYLADCPRVLRYALATARRYGALSGLLRVLESVEDAQARPAYTF